jgi:hypothetical protein
MGNMAGKKTKSNKTKKNSSKKPKHAVKVTAKQKTVTKPASRPPSSTMPSISLAVRSPAPSVAIATRPVFSIEIGSIGGETTIGDLIVAFPRTRDVLMKHGLRFDVEEAGYLYMTLNVFSAIHGLTTNNLVQELHTASKEPPLPPVVQPLRPIITAPTA